MVLLHSAEMQWRGQLREDSIRKLPIRFVQSNGTPHVPLNDPVSTSRIRESYLLHRFLQLPSVPPDRTQFPNVPVVGIIGGVGAGKTSVVRNVTQFRLFVIDADQIGHELLLTNDIRTRLRTAFGEEILDKAGGVVRERLAERVFGNSEEQIKNRYQLNEILHPAIREEICRSLQRAPQDVDAVILDAALLLEAGWADECDAVIFIDTPVELRRQRVGINRGWSAEELERREASQWSLVKKRQSAQYVVDNSGTLKAAAEQMTLVLEEIILKRLKRGGRDQ